MSEELSENKLQRDDFSKNIENVAGPIFLSAIAWGLVFIFGSGMETMEELIGTRSIFMAVAIFATHIILGIIIYNASKSRNSKLALLVVGFLFIEFTSAAYFGYSDVANGIAAPSSGPALAVFGLYKLISPFKYFIKNI